MAFMAYKYDTYLPDPALGQDRSTQYIVPGVRAYEMVKVTYAAPVGRLSTVVLLIREEPGAPALSLNISQRRSPAWSVPVTAATRKVMAESVLASWGGPTIETAKYFSDVVSAVEPVPLPIDAGRTPPTTLAQYLWFALLIFFLVPEMLECHRLHDGLDRLHVLQVGTGYLQADRDISSQGVPSEVTIHQVLNSGRWPGIAFPCVGQEHLEIALVQSHQFNFGGFESPHGVTVITKVVGISRPQLEHSRVSH